MSETTKARASKRRFPFTQYPVGWFQVGYSAELGPLDVQRVQYFGEDLVLFRGESGKPYLLDGYCPHLGAHMGCGGHVAGETIECPFHAWRFDGTGVCTEIPYATKIPKKARVHPWILREVNGIIFAYHGVNGEEPAWEVPVLPELESDEWTPVRTVRFRIKSHNQEMAENSVDGPHFLYVHKALRAKTAEAKIDGHIFRTFNKMEVDLTRWGMPDGQLEGSAQVTTHGFGFSVVRLSLLSEIITIATVTPIDEEHLDARFAFTVKKLDDPSMTDLVVQQVVDDIAQQVREDAVIWENKKYLERPVLCDGDGPIALYRKWARQFLPGYKPASGKRSRASLHAVAH